MLVRNQHPDLVIAWKAQVLDRRSALALRTVGAEIQKTAQDFRYLAEIQKIKSDELYQEGAKCQSSDPLAAESKFSEANEIARAAVMQGNYVQMLFVEGGEKISEADSLQKAARTAFVDEVIRIHGSDIDIRWSYQKSDDGVCYLSNGEVYGG